LRLSNGRGISSLGFGITIFSGAFLLFLVQPYFARVILPHYGGTASVWTACMLFFQFTLLAGYIYAHLLSRLLRQKLQIVIHLVLISLSALVLPVSSNIDVPDWNYPLLEIVYLLFASIGPPFLLLSGTSPLVQHWFSAINPNPYRLYALSNLGSLLALLCYPFLIEPWLGLHNQSLLWSSGYILYGLSCLFCGYLIYANNLQPATPPLQHPAPRTTPSIDITTRLLWLVLSAIGSIVLLATTNQLCLNIAVVPFLWVLPLAMYLISFIICFDNSKWFVRNVWYPFLLLMLVWLLIIIQSPGEFSLPVHITVYALTLFACCMVCHGEVASLKPATSNLTEFYMWIACGGLLGSIFVNVAAPMLFNGYGEFQIGLILSLTLTGYTYFRYHKPGRSQKFARVVWLGTIVFLTVFLSLQENQDNEGLISAHRDFYGTLKVYEKGEGTEGHFRSLYHDQINHGSELMQENYRHLPITYYDSRSGIGLTFKHLPRPASGLKIGIIGLGIGTLATYGTVNDHFRFYEINSDVKPIAEKYFYYLEDSESNNEYISGDARLSLQNEDSQNYDILIVDAFNGSTIPVHLLTREAWDLYWSHLKPNGVLAFHLTNTYLDLGRVIRGLNHQSGKQLLRIFRGRDATWGINQSDWALATSNHQFIANRKIQASVSRVSQGARKDTIWTDDYTNPLGILR
jgi:hypothetical protein